MFGVESAISKCDHNTTEEILQDNSRILGITSPPRRNVPNEEFQILRRLQQNEKIFILHAKEGNTTVLLDLEDYDKGIKATYTRNHINKNHKIKEMLINEDTEQQLIAREKSPRL